MWFCTHKHSLRNEIPANRDVVGIAWCSYDPTEVALEAVRAAEIVEGGPDKLTLVLGAPDPGPIVPLNQQSVRETRVDQGVT